MDYVALRGEISATNIRLHELMEKLSGVRRAAGLTFIEQEKNGSQENVLSIYESAIENLTEEIARVGGQLQSLTERLPCQALIDATSLEFHEFYRARHAITRHTKVIEDFFGNPGVTYDVPETVSDFAIGSTLPATFTNNSRHVEFERFVHSVNGATTYYEIAFSPEIDTLWYRVKHHGR